MKNIKLIDSLNNNKTQEQYTYLYCIANNYLDFVYNRPRFEYNLKRRLVNVMGYNIYSLTRGQKSYITRLTNLLMNKHYFLYFLKKWIIPINIFDLEK